VIESVDAIAQGVGAVRSDPNSGFGYFQIGIGAFGIGVNTTAIARSISRIDAFAPNRGTMTGGIYRTGRGEFVDIDRAGTAIRNLSTSKIKVTDRGIGVVENHLSRFGNWGHNNAMLKRLRDISSGKAKPTQIDLDFYAHELRESVRLRQLGNATGEVSRPLYLKAHNAALREYGIPFGAEESRLYTDFARQFLFFAE
jgi:hypothetical protein